MKSNLRVLQENQHCNREVFGGKALPGVGCGLQQTPQDTSSQHVLCSTPWSCAWAQVSAPSSNTVQSSWETQEQLQSSYSCATSATAKLTSLCHRQTEMDFKMEQAPGNKGKLENLRESREANLALLFILHSACKSGHLCSTFFQLYVRERFLNPRPFRDKRSSWPQLPAQLPAIT